MRRYTLRFEVSGGNVDEVLWRAERFLGEALQELGQPGCDMSVDVSPLLTATDGKVTMWAGDAYARWEG